VLKTKENVKNILAENLNQNDDRFLGFRLVEKKFIKNLLQKFDGILAVTSANKSNHEASISADEVKKYFTNSKLALLIDGVISICTPTFSSCLVEVTVVATVEAAVPVVVPCALCCASTLK
jgi:tRNA A37 threonylcarbamoyladenosine synthetase subunit TsaC/SUA5/YrdC